MRKDIFLLCCQYRLPRCQWQRDNPPVEYLANVAYGISKVLFQLFSSCYIKLCKYLLERVANVKITEKAVIIISTFKTAAIIRLVLV